MDNLADILARKDYDLPSEVVIIKRYAQEHFGSEISVKLQGKDTIVIAARSAAFINTLRLHQVDLKRACQTDKKFIFRIG